MSLTKNERKKCKKAQNKLLDVKIPTFWGEYLQEKTSLSYILKRRRDVGKCFEERLRGGELGKNLGKF